MTTDSGENIRFDGGRDAQAHDVLEYREKHVLTIVLVEGAEPRHVTCDMCGVVPAAQGLDN